MIKFEYVLVEVVGMDQSEVKRLIQILDINRSNELNYRTVLEWLKNSEEVNKYFDSIL